MKSLNMHLFLLKKVQLSFTLELTEVNLNCFFFFRSFIIVSIKNNVKLIC